MIFADVFCYRHALSWRGLCKVQRPGGTNHLKACCLNAHRPQQDKHVLSRSWVQSQSRDYQSWRSLGKGIQTTHRRRHTHVVASMTLADVEPLSHDLEQIFPAHLEPTFLSEPCATYSVSTTLQMQQCVIMAPAARKLQRVSLAPISANLLMLPGGHEQADANKIRTRRARSSSLDRIMQPNASMAMREASEVIAAKGKPMAKQTHTC